MISDCRAKERYNLADDIVECGIVLTGGGAQTPGLADDLQASLNLPVRVAEDPQLAVIKGAGVVLGELDGLRRSGMKSPTNWAGLLIFGLIMLNLGKIRELIARVFELVFKAFC